MAGRKIAARGRRQRDPLHATGGRRMHGHGDESTRPSRSARRAPLPGLHARSESPARRCAAKAAPPASARTADAGSADGWSASLCSGTCTPATRSLAGEEFQSMPSASQLYFAARFISFRGPSLSDRTASRDESPAPCTSPPRGPGLCTARLSAFLTYACLLLVVGEDFRIDADAFVAGGALRRIDPRARRIAVASSAAAAEPRLARQEPRTAARTRAIRRCSSLPLPAISISCAASVCANSARTLIRRFGGLDCRPHTRQRFQHPPEIPPVLARRAPAARPESRGSAGSSCSPPRYTGICLRGRRPPDPGYSSSGIILSFQASRGTVRNCLRKRPSVMAKSAKVMRQFHRCSSAPCSSVIFERVVAASRSRSTDCLPGRNILPAECLYRGCSGSADRRAIPPRACSGAPPDRPQCRVPACRGCRY